MTLYATCACRAEVARLKISGIDSRRMIIHNWVAKDRHVMLKPSPMLARRQVISSFSAYPMKESE
jgi:integrase/recombinase XerD